VVRARTENARGARKTMIVALAQATDRPAALRADEGVVPDGVFARFFQSSSIFDFSNCICAKANLPARRSQLTRNSSPEPDGRPPRCRSTRRGERSIAPVGLKTATFVRARAMPYTPFLQVTQRRHTSLPSSAASLKAIVLGEGWGCRDPSA